MPVKNAGKRGQRELECGPIRHKMHLFFRYFFYLSSCFQTENLPWPDCQSRFLHKLTRFSLQKARDFYSLLVRFTFGDIYAKRPAGPCNGTDPSLRWRFRRPPAPGRWRSPGWPKKSGRVRPPFSPIAPDVPARHWLPPGRHDKQQVVGVAAGIHRLQGMQCAKLRFHDPFAGGRQRSRIGLDRQQGQPGFALLRLFVHNTGDPVAHSQPVGGQVHILLPQRQQLSLGKPRGKGKPNQVAPQVIFAYRQQLFLFLSGEDGLFPVETLYELFGWNPDFKYRIAGTLFQTADETAFIFQVDDAEALLRPSVISYDGTDASSKVTPMLTSGKRIRAVPEKWASSFGAQYYAHQSVSSNIPRNEADWKLRMEGQLYESGLKLNVTSFDQLERYIQRELTSKERMEGVANE